MTSNYKLLVEPSGIDVQSFDYIYQESNLNAEKSMVIRGPYMMADEVNKNKRMYPLQEMVREVGRYTNEMINNKRSLGELNHPTNAEVSLDRACHMVTKLTQDRNYFLGESKLLSSPMGKIVENLIKDGVQVGMSSRALGKLTDEKGVNRVSEMRLVAIDCVADPSCPKAFVNGILESKNWILNHDGDFESTYEEFEASLANLPRKQVETYLKDQLLTFINKISK
tara:strand:+ start:179 stop:853 length:675 start_codon:yes stop_codon:yes gene_type:complete